MNSDDLDKFWEKVHRRSKKECWNWTGGTQSKGYGMFNINGVSILAHRYSYTIYKGSPVNCVLHTCDNRLCVNPDHLYDGLPKMNTRDMIERGRSGKLFQRKFSNDTKNSIRELYQGGSYTYEDLVKQFGVSKSEVCRIITGKR